MGYNTIGSDVAEVLGRNRDVIANQAEREVELEYVLSLRELPNSLVIDRIVHDFKVIEQDEEMKIAVGAMDGLNPVYPFVKACLMAGKNMVTSNKALVAVHGIELLAIARKRHVNFSLEASAGGGIPIIRPLHRCLIGECIKEITDILNGTTNFILAKVDKEGEPFENALREAQNLGYAKRSPETDVKGYGTYRKIVILTTMATEKEVNYEDTYTEGVTRTTDIDFKYVEKMGTSVKLLGTSRIKDDKVLAYMASVITNKTSSLYSVNDVLNDTLVKGNILGISMLYSSDAERLPTKSAVVADIVEVTQNLKKNVSMGWTDEKQAIKSMDQARLRYFVRAAGSHRNRGRDVKSAFGQVEVVELYGMDEFVFLIAQVAKGEFRKATVSYDSREQERSEYGIKQMIRAALWHMASIVSQIIGGTVRQGLSCLFHLLAGLCCPGCGGTRASRTLLVGNPLLGIRYHPLIAYMAVVLTAELVSFTVSRAAKNPRYYLGHEELPVYTDVAIALVDWVYKDYMLVARGVDLLPLWSR